VKVSGFRIQTSIFDDHILRECYSWLKVKFLIIFLKRDISVFRIHIHIDLSADADADPDPGIQHFKT